MYRQYENPRTLEKELNKLKITRNNIIYEIARLNPLRKEMINKNKKYEELSEQLIGLEEIISDLEERVNFAWQDEEYDTQPNFF